MFGFSLRSALPALALGLWLAWPAHGVIIDAPDGTGNTSAPADDPGWAHVGTKAGMTAIYLGNGWVLTANHAGTGDVTFQGTLYPAVEGSGIRLHNVSGPRPDLRVFQIEPSPNLPILPIRSTTPTEGTPVVMIGQGRNRGSATSWNPTGPPGPYDGYEWLSSKSLRWGTNEVGDSSSVSLPCWTPVLDTECFYTDFSETGTDEAQVANGDSGGAAFIKNGGVWELAGVLYALGEYDGQPADLALYGNLSYAADLASYRDQIIAFTRPQCSDEIDNDGDELVDFPADLDCLSLADRSERPAGLPSLSTWGLALLVGLLAGTPLWIARRRHLASP